MSEYRRFKRLIKSIIPRFPGGGDRTYTSDDAKMIINDLALEIPPKVLAKIMQSDIILDDFLNNIYYLEADIRKRVVNEFSVVDPKFKPKVYIEDGMLGFTVTHKKEEIVFAEYRIRKKGEKKKASGERSEESAPKKKQEDDGFDDLKHSGL